jgi:hypothetical protein
MIDDPLSLLMQGIWLLAAGMYPLGFMFGTCSACCCRNNTCEGFDLDEAFGGARTQGSRTVCSYSANGSHITFPASPFFSFPPVAVGCRVFGQGIPQGAVVTSLEDVYEPPRVFRVSKNGCCRIEIDYNQCIYDGFDLVGQENFVRTLIHSNGITTEEQCDAAATMENIDARYFGFFQETCPERRFSGFQGYGVILEIRKTFTPCVSCQGTPLASNLILETESTLTGRRLTISPAPSGAVTGCLSFCGTAGKCGPFARTSFDNNWAFGPYGAGVPIPGGCCNIQYQQETCILVDGQFVPSGNISNVSDVREASSSSECSERSAFLIASQECSQSQFGLNSRILPGSVTSNYTEGFNCDGSPRRTYPSDYRRNCVRWVCRCYEGTGRRGVINPETGQPLFPNPEDWYTVQSTNVIGGPTTNNLDLEQALSDARNDSGVPVEQALLFPEWNAEEGDVRCLVWAFVFYGKGDFSRDLCNLPYPRSRKTYTSGDNLYYIAGCNRCS